MASLLAALPIVFQQPTSGTRGEHVEAMDWFVMINLAFLFFMLGFFACWAWLIWRRTTRPPPHIQLIMELDEVPDHEPADTTGNASEPERAPWERESDWWQK